MVLDGLPRSGDGCAAECAREHDGCHDDRSLENSLHGSAPSVGRM